MKRNKNELNEQIICKCQTHWSVLIVPAIVSFFFLLASVMGIVDAAEDRMFGVVFAIISILIFVIPFLRLKTNQLVLTDKRIYGKTGIIKTQSLTAPIQKIQTVNLKKGIVGRIFGYSDITIHCVTGVYIFKKQVNAEEMQNAILNAVN